MAKIANIPLVISGGFTPHNVAEVKDDEWSILIVGGAFIRAPDPAAILTAIQEAIEPRT